MTKKEHFKRVIDWFETNMPVAETELHYQNSYQLLVAVILSAQCTDKRVNIITPPLFQQFPDALSLSQSSVEEIFSYIKSCSYPNNKAKSLLGMAKKLTETFHSIVPEEIDQLQTLPGVGRKTANVIASVAFNKPAMAVDTHVFRVAERIGLTTNAKNPYDSEMQLVKNIPDEFIPNAHHWLLLHGRYVCIARKPKCEECGIKSFCRFYSNNNKK